MIVTPVPIVLPPPSGGLPRSQGVHVSSIIRCIATEAGILKPEWAEELSLVQVSSQTEWWDSLVPSVKLRIAMGLAWEQWYIPQLTHIADHPGEMCVDDVYMTPDGESLDTIVTERGEEGYILAVHEIKLTYKSVNTVGHDLKGQYMWIAQLLAYCRGLNTTRAYLHVLFVCGNYKPAFEPQIGPIKGQNTAYRVDFTPEEVEAGWRQLIDYKTEFEARV